MIGLLDQLARRPEVKMRREVAIIRAIFHMTILHLWYVGMFLRNYDEADILREYPNESTGKKQLS